MDAVSAFAAGLGSVLGDGVLNGLGYRVTMNMSIDTNFNNSLIYDLRYDLTAASIDAALVFALTESYDSSKGSVAYSGEGYYADGNKCVAGKAITITVTPKDGYQVDKLFVNGNELTDYTVGANNVITYTGAFDGAISVNVTFKEALFAASASLSRLTFLATVSVEACNSDGTKTINVVFEKATSGNSIIVQLPKGTWTITFKNSSGNVVATGTVTITGADGEFTITITQ